MRTSLLLCWLAAATSAAAGRAIPAPAHGGVISSKQPSALPAAARSSAALDTQTVTVGTAAAAAAAAAASTSDRLAWMREYASTDPWAAAAPVEQSVSIVLMTSHFFGQYANTVPCGPVRGAAPGTPGAWNLTCVYSENQGGAEAADALWYHLPTSPRTGQFADGTSFVAKPHQLAVGLTMESAAYYPAMDDPAFMAHFGVDATYRRSAHVQAAYWTPGYKNAWEARPPLPFEAKKPAVAYLSSNCGAPSGRDAIAGRLMEIFNDTSTPGALRVDGLGACRRTSDAAAGYARMAAGDLLRTYRFCIAIENSVAPDYVSEKVYNALAAGCTPIYLGAADIAAFIPVPSAVIDYRALGGTPEALAAELVRLNADAAAYAEHHAWRALPPAGWSPAFRRLVARGSVEHTQCQICRRVAMHRAQWKAGVVGGGGGTEEGGVGGGSGGGSGGAPRAPADAEER